MATRFWWILLAVIVGAIIAGSLLAVQYAEQQVPNESVDESGLR